MLSGLSMQRMVCSFVLTYFSTKYFFTIPLRKISASLFIPTLTVSYLMGLLLILWEMSGESTTIGNNCEDLFFSVLCLWNVIKVWVKALKNFLSFVVGTWTVEEFFSFWNSILKIILLFRAVFLIIEEYLLWFMELSSLTEFERFNDYIISLSLYSCRMTSFYVCADVLILIIMEWFLDMPISFVSFFRMGWRPSWYLSGSTELTLLISRNLKCLMGLLTSRCSLD